MTSSEQDTMNEAANYDRCFVTGKSNIYLSLYREAWCFMAFINSHNY